MTLPTRDDGGIDWSKTYEQIWNFKGDLAYESRESLMKLAAAHARERCAKIAEAPDGPDPDGNIAAAIRKMED